MRRLTVLCLILAALAAPVHAQPSNVERVAQKGPVTEYRLVSNGMPILLVRRDAAPVVTFMVVYRIGSRNEGPGTTGSAHLLEHMLFNKSTATFGKASGGPTIQVALHEVGVDFSSTNMTTWKDVMKGFSTVPSDRLELAVRIEAERMRTARILDAERQPEMSVVRNEYEISENDPSGVLEKAVSGAAMVAHPYRWDTLGYRSDIEGVTTEQLREHYRRYFWPDNAAAIVVGDFEPENALALIDRYFGAIPRSAQPIPKVITVEPPQEGERRVIVARPGNVRLVELAWHRPGIAHRDWHALEVLSSILGTGRSSHLYRALVEPGLAEDVGVYNDPFQDPYLIEPHAELAPDVDPAKAEAAMRAVVHAVRDKGVTPQEVARAVRGIEVGLASRQDGVFTMADALSDAVGSASWQWHVDYLDALRKVTAADVQRVARRYMADDRVTVGWYVPGKAAEPESQAAPVPDTVLVPGTVPGQGAVPAPGKGPAAAPSPQPEARPTGSAQAPPTRTDFAARTLHRVSPRGLVLDVLPNHAAPTVAIHAILRAGAAYAPRSQPELAAVTAEMLSRGTTSRGARQLAEALEDMGATLEWQAGTYDATVRGYCVREDVPALLDLLADEVLHPAFADDELAKVRLQRKGQLLSEAESTSTQAQDALFRIVFPPSHPLHPMPLEARAKSVDGITAKDVRDFHRRLYHGGNLIISIVGDVDPQETAKLVEARFASLPEGAPPVLDAPRGTAPPAQQKTHKMPGKANADLVLGTASGLRRGDPDYYACVLANAVFGQDSLTSRVGRRVRDTEGLSYYLNSRFLGTDALDGVWALDVRVAPQNVRKALASSREVLADFMTANVTEAELQAQKGFFAGSFQVRMATNVGLAAALAEAEKLGLGPKYLDDFPAIIEGVTLAQVNDAIRRHFSAGTISVVVAGDCDEKAIR